MCNNINNYNFSGNLGADSEVRYTPSGSPILSFSVGVNHGFGENKGTNWVKCSVYGKRAEGKLSSLLKKGVKVSASGELKVREWKDKKGEKNYSLNVDINQVVLM